MFLTFVNLLEKPELLNSYRPGDSIKQVDNNLFFGNIGGLGLARAPAAGPS